MFLRINKFFQYDYKFCIQYKKYLCLCVIFASFFVPNTKNRYLCQAYVLSKK